MNGKILMGCKTANAEIGGVSKDRVLANPRHIFFFLVTGGILQAIEGTHSA